VARTRTLASALVALVTTLVVANARADFGDRHPYDDVVSSDRPEVYGDMVAGWRSSTTSVLGDGAARPDAWGALFGMHADIYSGKREKFSGRSTIDAAGGGGTWGDWRAQFDFTVGERLDLGGNSGFVIRGGVHAHTVGAYGTADKTNARSRNARIDVPVTEIAYQRTHGLGLFELGVRSAFTLYGQYAPGDASRTFTLTPGLGAYLAWHHDDLHLELDAMQASIAHQPVTFVSGLLCSTASMFALCGDVRYVAGVVEGETGAPARAIASWHVGATIGVGFDFATTK
jgi:hypothetical protein